MNKTLIFGAGYLGKKFNGVLPDSELTTVDITDRLAMRSALDQFKPDFVINCAGKTGGAKTVDWCEEHQEETYAANVIGPIILAELCKERGIHFTQLGSGCVYEGDNDGKGFAEDDPPNFYGSYYSRTKIECEQKLKELGGVLQLRPRMPVDDEPGTRNLITKLVKYKTIISVPNSVSIISDFLSAARQLIEKRATGVYNLTNPGAITHAQILEQYQRIIDPKFTFEIISVDELLEKKTKTGRSNCVLNTDKLATEGISLPPIQEAIISVLNEYKKKI